MGGKDDGVAGLKGKEGVVDQSRGRVGAREDTTDDLEKSQSGNHPEMYNTWQNEHNGLNKPRNRKQKGELKEAVKNTTRKHTPMGSATRVTPPSSSSSMTPQVLVFLYCKRVKLVKSSSSSTELNWKKSLTTLFKSSVSSKNYERKPTDLVMDDLRSEVVLDDLVLNDTHLGLLTSHLGKRETSLVGSEGNLSM